MDMFKGFRARPLVAVAALYLFGTLYGFFGFERHGWLIAGVVVAIVSVATVAAGLDREKWGRVALVHFPCYLVLLVASSTLAFVRCRPPDPNGELVQSLLTAETSGEPLTAEGEIVTDPDVIVDRERGRQTARFVLRVSSMTMPDGREIATNHRLNVYMRDVRDPLPRYGETWRAQGRVLRSKWARPRVRRYLSVWQRESECTGEGGGVGFLRKCYAVRQWAATRLALGIEEHDEAVAMMQALLLGYRTRVDSSIRDTFAETGAVHVFAISGLHVGIVAMMSILILRLTGISRERWVLVLAPILICYTATTGMRASAVRACLMAIVYFSGPLLGRKPDGFSALAFAALAILVVSPAQAVDVGFIFSFTVVLGLISLYRVCYWPFRDLAHADELRLQPEGRPMVLVRKLGSWAASLFALSAAAWLTSAPLTAYVFGRFSLAALVSNFAVVPVTAAIVSVGFLSLIAGSCFEILGVCLNHVNLVCVHALLLFVRTAANVPYACIHVDSVPGWAVVLWYLLLAGAAFLLNTRMRRRSADPEAVMTDP